MHDKFMLSSAGLQRHEWSQELMNISMLNLMYHTLDWMNNVMFLLLSIKLFFFNFFMCQLDTCMYLRHIRRNTMLYLTLINKNYIFGIEKPTLIGKSPFHREVHQTENNI